MKYATNLILLVISVFTLSLVSLSTQAQDSTLRAESPHFGEEGWDVRLGLGLIASSGEFYRGMKEESGLTLLLEASYHNGNFFFNANEEDSLLVGYSLLRNGDWVIDMVFGPKFGINFDDSDDFDNQLSSLHNRDVDGQLGARFSWYGDSNRLSISLTRDVVGAHDGFLALLDYQQEKQLRNWLLTGRAGLILMSEKMTNHIVGVSASETTATIPEYKADAGQAVLLELKLEYPVNENWIFESRASWMKVGNDFQQSPITVDDSISIVTTGFKYQF